MISSTKNEEMSSGNDEKEAKLDAEAMQEAARGKLNFRYALQKFRRDCEIFAMRQQEASWIFAMHCENFTRIAKISQP